jgi:hypothetical protein
MNTVLTEEELRKIKEKIKKSLKKNKKYEKKSI